MGKHPGQVRMKCMIWEPAPIALRRRQDEQFIYSYDTLKKIPNLLEYFDFYQSELLPPSFCLRQNHVYRDTFLQLKDGAMLQPDRWGLRAMNGEPLFEAVTSSDSRAIQQGLDSRNPMKFPWMYHQTFILSGSLFGNSAMTSDTPACDGTCGDPRWTYRWLDVPYETNGDPNEATEWKDTGYAETLSADAQIDILTYIQSRKNKRLLPVQVAVSSEGFFKENDRLTGTAFGTTSSTTQTTLTAPTPRPIHWLAEKLTPMYNGEDFFVEFIRQSAALDMVTNAKNTSMIGEYEFLDSNLLPVSVPDAAGRVGQALLNGAVASLNNEGKIPKESQIDLGKQSYYLIEIGHQDPEHNYFILFPYGGSPMFIHAGDFPVILEASINMQGEEQTVIASPILGELDRKHSRVLSTYPVTCKSLMDGGTLRVSVRNYKGKIIVILNGNANNPWVIERNDYDISEISKEKPLDELKQNNVYMIVPPRPIRIGAGNIMCGFTFGPEAYSEWASFNAPNAICVRAPVDQNDINCFLRDKNAYHQKNDYYYQEADVYVEIVKGQQTFTSRESILKAPSNGPIEKDDKRTLKGWNENKTLSKTFTTARSTQDGSFTCNMSTIEIQQISTLRDPPPSASGSTTLDNNGSTTENNDTPSHGEWGEPPGTSFTSQIPTAAAKYFDASYAMHAGDVVVGKDDPKRAWLIKNCVTPIANGWRISVDPSTAPLQAGPVVDVAHHVMEFSANSTFTDAIRVEHNGNIRFLINIGDATGTISGKTDGTNKNDKKDKAKDPDPSTIDQSKFLIKLADKTFFLRIYAWWDGGYMQCEKTECSCKKDPTVFDGTNKKIIFTGLSHGGEISVEGGLRTMTCQLLDYWKILQDINFLNSPFFDGMRNFNAIDEILQIAGFVDESNGTDKYPPRAFISRLANGPQRNDENPKGAMNGEQYWLQDYALPSAFDILQSAMLKFKDNEHLDAAIVKMAQFDGKMAYFDRYGSFQLRTRPDQYFCAPTSRAFFPKCNFYASPKEIPGDSCGNLDALSIGVYSYRRLASDAPNELHLLTTTPKGELLIASDVNIPSKFDPTAEGFTGYTKRLLQVDGIFGSQEALQKLLKYYQGFYRPPVVMKWTSMGIAQLMAGDVVTFTGLADDDALPPQTRDVEKFYPGSNVPARTVTLYITSLSTTITAKENSWTNEYEGEWIFIGEIDCKPTQK